MMDESFKKCDLVFRDLPELEQLKGATIFNIGFVEKDQKKLEGGLAIDYYDFGEIKRIILGFTELGMWIEWHGKKEY